MTVCALMIGRAGSTGLLGKNTMQVLGKPLCAYPLMAARASRYVDHVFVSTDCPEIMEVGRKFGAALIERPPELATKEALGEDAFLHGYREIVGRCGAVELLVLLMANAATVTGALIDEGIEALLRDPTLDSAVTTSVYNMWSPLRARRLGPDGCLVPFVPLETFGDPAVLNCDRDSQGDVYYADMGASVVRPRCLEHMEDGLLPQRWMGRRIYPIRSAGGCDIDYAWQVPQVEHWLRSHGIGRPSEPFIPQPQGLTVS